MAYNTNGVCSDVACGAGTQNADCATNLCDAGTSLCMVCTVGGGECSANSGTQCDLDVSGYSNPIGACVGCDVAYGTGGAVSCTSPQYCTPELVCANPCSGSGSLTACTGSDYCAIDATCRAACTTDGDCSTIDAA